MAGAALARGVRRQARRARATSGSWSRPRSSTPRSPRWCRSSTRGDTIIDGGNSWYHDDVDRAAAARRRPRHPLRRRRHERRRVRPRARLLPDDRRPRRRRRPAGADLRHARARRRRAPSARRRWPRAATRRRPAERGWLHCGPNGAGHFVKMVHNGIEYGLMAAYAEGLNVLAKANIGAAAPPPGRRDGAAHRTRSTTSTTSTWPRSPRSGGAAGSIASWLLDLTADAFAADPHLERATRAGSATPARAAGRSSAAIDEGVPVPVLATALFERFTLARPGRPRRQGAVGDARRVRRARRAEGQHSMNGDLPRPGNQPPADALVLFGATGDLAKRKLFPALYHLVRRGELKVPVIGVARSDWTDDDFRAARPRVGHRQRRGLRRGRHPRHVRTARPHPGRLRRARDVAVARRHARPSTAREVAVFYMAIPPDMFPTVAEKLASVGLNKRGRIVVEKPFGRDLESALELNRAAARRLPRGAHLPHRPLPRQGGRRGPPRVPLLQHAARAAVEPELRPQRAGHDGRVDRRRGPRQLLRGRRRASATSCRTTCCRSSACWRWSRRSIPTPSFLQDEKAKVLAAMEPIDPQLPRARAVRRLPRRARRRSPLDGRDVRRDAPA